MNKPNLDIIKSPVAEHMLKNVTEGFYDKSYIGLWMFETIGREYDEMADWARNLKLEANPQTCTWSIGIWEFIYGIESGDTLPLEIRRQRIMSKRLSRPPLNPERIEAALSAIIGCPVTITNPIAPYTFRVTVYENSDSVLNYQTILKELRKMKPSHLSLRLTGIMPAIALYNSQSFAVRSLHRLKLSPFNIHTSNLRDGTHRRDGSITRAGYDGFVPYQFPVRLIHKANLITIYDIRIKSKHLVVLITAINNTVGTGHKIKLPTILTYQARSLHRAKLTGATNISASLTTTGPIRRDGKYNRDGTAYRDGITAKYTL